MSYTHWNHMGSFKKGAEKDACTAYQKLWLSWPRIWNHSSEAILTSRLKRSHWFRLCCCSHVPYSGAQIHTQKNPLRKFIEDLIPFWILLQRGKWCHKTAKATDHKQKIFENIFVRCHSLITNSLGPPACILKSMF